MTKRTLKITVVAGAVLAALCAFADWQSDYERAVDAAKDGNWAQARESFLAAVAQRGEDSNEPTRLPGPVTEPRFWRGGSLYSANFGAAYAAYQLGRTSTDETEKQTNLNLAASEFRTLIEKGQISAELLKVLGRTYDALGDKTSRQGLREMQPNWKVDTSFVVPDDQALPNQGGINPATGGQVPTISGDPNGNGGVIIKVKAGQEKNLQGIFGDQPVVTLENKYALIIGNSIAGDRDSAIAFGATDAEAVRDAITQYGGYETDNVTTLTNASAAQIRAAAAALAQSIPNDAVVMIYFTGVAANLGGRDYFAGSDAEFPTDTSKMVEKMEVLRPLTDKGASVYLFSQTNRPMEGGNYFGQERVLRGTVSEAHATIPGGSITSIVTGGKETGLYTYAFVQTLKTFYTNEIPITEFCWNVFYTMRRGTNTESTGGSIQTPSLPVLTNMGREHPF